MYIIELNNGLNGIVDDVDAELAKKHTWHASKYGNTYYIARTDRAGGTKKTVLLHREIMQPKGALVVDHINRIGVDNRRKNLRLCTKSENSQNLNRRGGVDEYIKGKWRYRVTVRGKGYKKHGFRSEADARAALVDFIKTT